MPKFLPSSHQLVSSCDDCDLGNPLMVILHDELWRSIASEDGEPCASIALSDAWGVL